MLEKNSNKLLQSAKPFFIKTISPLHVGSGSDLGVVDMPIQRESHTSFPKIEASSLKGALRSEYSELDTEEIFGKDDSRGKVSFSDARILFFPVKSVKGIFAYITCPYVLKRFHDDISLCEKDIKDGFTLPLLPVDEGQCIVLDGSKNKIDNTDNKSHVVLEEYSFEVLKIQTKESITLPNLDIDKERIVIVSDDEFKEFVKNSTEVITRIKIGDKGVVDKDNGALFTEEYLPAESYMYFLSMGERVDVMDSFDVTQIGGNATLGKGIVKIMGNSSSEENKGE